MRHYLKEGETVESTSTDFTVHIEPRRTKPFASLLHGQISDAAELRFWHPSQDAWFEVCWEFGDAGHRLYWDDGLDSALVVGHFNLSDTDWDSLPEDQHREFHLRYLDEVITHGKN